MTGSHYRCDFCEIAIKLLPRGRPPRFCSKRCRQADYREQHRLVGLSVHARAGRRRDARHQIELERKLSTLVDRPDWRARQDLTDSARKLAVEAWPYPDRTQLEDWPVYVANRGPGRLPSL